MFSLASIYLFFDFRLNGSIWSWTKVTVWRTTTANSRKHSTPTMELHIAFFWLVHHYRIDCQNYGHCWTSYCLVFLLRHRPLRIGSMHRSKWQVKRWNWMRKRRYWLLGVCTRYIKFSLLQLFKDPSGSNPCRRTASVCLTILLGWRKRFNSHFIRDWSKSGMECITNKVWLWIRNVHMYRAYEVFIFFW